MASLAVLGGNFLTLIIASLILWRLSVRLRDVSFIDAWWPTGMVLVAGLSLFERRSAGLRAELLFLLCAVWGLRLGGHLFLRWRRLGPDPRYTAMLEDAAERRGWSFAKGSLLLVFALQAPLQMVVSAPVQLGQTGKDIPLTALSGAGALLSAFGVLFEGVADWQLAAFRADPNNLGGIMDHGLWRYTRHPNYFGEACVWWGLFLLASPAPLGIWSLPGPVLLTLLLTKGSGVPTVEKRLKARGEAYADYVRRTPGFVPWFPKPARP